MKDFRRYFTLLLAVVAVIGAIALTGCEDDPILTPENGDGTSGGSYGRIDQIGTETDPAGKLVHTKRRADAATNPALF